MEDYVNEQNSIKTLKDENGALHLFMEDYVKEQNRIKVDIYEERKQCIALFRRRWHEQREQG